MATSEFYTCPEDEAMLLPGEALLNCNGQDITKKNAGKARNRILTIFPSHLGLPLKLTDCVLGNIRNLNSDAPEFVINTEQGELVFKGKFEYPSTKFLSITCQPSTAKKTGQSALTDVFDRVLVFEEPTLLSHGNGSTQSAIFRSSSTNSATSELFGTQNSSISDAGDATPPASGYSTHFGMSCVADPIRPATAKRVGTSTSASKALSSSSKNKIRSSAQKNGSPKKRSRSQRSEGSDSSEDSGSESDVASHIDAIESDDSAADDSASDVEEELGSAALWSDSPVLDRRSSSRRASAAKAVSYHESDEEEEEDTRSYSSTNSNSSTASTRKTSRPATNSKVKPIDMTESSDDDVQIVTKPKASRATPKPSAEKAKATPKPKIASSATKATPKVSKTPTARKLATSSAKKTKKSGYFSSDGSESEEENNEDQDSASASSSDLSPVRVTARARATSASVNKSARRPASANSKIDSDEASEHFVDGSDESDYLFEDTSTSKKRKANAAKPRTQTSTTSTARKSTPASSAKKAKVSTAEKATKKPAAPKAKATKAPTKRSSKKIDDSDEEVITIEDSESNDSDDDYED